MSNHSPRQADTVLTGQIQIKKQQINKVSACLILQSLGAIDADNPMPVRAQQLHERLSQVIVILNNDDI